VHVIGSCEWGRKRREGPYLKSSLPYMWVFIFSFTRGKLREEKRTKARRREGGR